MSDSSLGIRRSIRPRSLAAVGVVGAALGTGWDMLHVVSHTTVYSIGAGRLPLWVPLEFALVYVVGVTGFALLGRSVPHERSRHLAGAEAVWVTGVYAMTAALHRHETVVVVIAAAALLFRAGRMISLFRANPLPAIALIVLGPAVEAVLIGAGVFRYQAASLGNIPVWLPLLYANAVPFAMRLTESAMTRDR